MAGKLGIDDPQLAKDYAKQIKTQADNLNTVITSLTKLVNELHATWHGPDSNQFHDTTWPQHKTQLQNAHTSLITLHSTVTKNIAAQESTSSTLN